MGATAGALDLMSPRMTTNPQMDGSVVKALVFDAYGTLFDVHSVMTLTNEMFPGRGEAVSQLWRSRQLEYTWLLSLMGRYEDFWAVTEKALVFTCASLQLACDASTRSRLMDAYLRLSAFPEAAAALKALARLPLAILSNGSPKMLAAVVQSAGLTGVFRDVISVEDVRIYKPSPRVYGLAPPRLGLTPAEIGFVSSNSFDVQGARAFGFRTFWVNRAGGPAEELGLTPHATIRNLTELPGAIAAPTGGEAP
jgi:2-haloacid dehalogenase